ncbi:DUF2971 domain-containing protein [Agarivorans sp. Alg241-V36]|uniref:DUF2971 domain-containing protein n=1 Tax=Agarivorans sp. Alg241-V36 TaxID=2305992 RepID=UPI0013D4D15A|nr:DUF2971 domain-containing protein [Agarivorans sp. Alg241-V36]
MTKFLPLYKFREVNELSIGSIINNTLWFSYVEKFNDPFELFYDLTSGVSIQDFHSNLDLFLEFANPEHKFIKEDFEKLLGSMTTAEKEQTLFLLERALFPLHKSALERIKNGIKIFSLSKTNRHPLLWGHYADGLKGMCIEYDLNKQPEPLNIGYCDVDYTEKPFKLNLLEMLESGRRIHDYSDKIYATKNSVWGYEEELRLISNDDVMKGNAYQLDKAVIRSICIGERMSNENQLKVVNAVKGRDIAIYKAIAIPSEFKVDIVEYN